eukprot:8581905-Karenia_brevis.AAC.1
MATAECEIIAVMAHQQYFRYMHIEMLTTSIWLMCLCWNLPGHRPYVKIDTYTYHEGCMDMYWPQEMWESNGVIM